MATTPPASRGRCWRHFAGCTRPRCGSAAPASIAWRGERSGGGGGWRGGRRPPSGARGSGRSSGSGASGPSTCSTRSFGAARPSAPSGAPLPSPRYECDSPGHPGRVRTSARSPRAPPRPAPGPSQRDHDARHLGRPGLRDGVRDRLGAVGWLPAALERGVRSAGRPLGARGRAGDGVRGVLRLDARPGGRSGPVYGDRRVLPAGRRGSEPDGPGGRALLRGAHRLAARVVRPGAGRRAGHRGEGGDRAAGRAGAAARGADHGPRGREPGGVVVLDRRRGRARRGRDGGAARRARRAHDGRTARLAGGPPRYAAGPRRRAAISERDLIVPKRAGRDIAPATGKLGVMLVGLGAVSTTFIAGVENVRRGGGLPIGSLTQMGTIRLGKRIDRRSPKLKEFLPLAGVADLVFAAWDPIPVNAYTAARKAGGLEPPHLEPIADFLKGIKPLPAAFDQDYVKRYQDNNGKPGKPKA